MARKKRIHLDIGGVAVCGGDGVVLTRDPIEVTCKNCLRSPLVPSDLRRSRPSGDKIWVPAGACDAIAVLIASYKGDRKLWNKISEIIYAVEDI